MNPKTNNGYSKLRVCHLTSVHHAADTRIFHKECKSLANFGFDVNLVVPRDLNEKKLDVPAGIRIRALPKARHRLERFTRTAWQVYKAARKIDAALYHFHDPELIPVGLLLTMEGRKVIYDIHEDVPRAMLSPGHYYLPRGSKRLISWLLEKLENLAARRLVACVTATPHIESRFRKIQPNVITVNNFPISDELSLKHTSTKWNSRENAVAYVGTIDLTRGLREMVQSLECLPANLEARLKLVGGFASANCRDQIQRLDGWKKVDELGFLGRDDIGQVLSRVKAGLVLIHPEDRYVVSQPTKLFEYMSAGIPVIASNFPLWREVVEGERCGLVVDPLNPHEIAAAIEYLLTHSDEAEAMGCRGREAVEQRYNWTQEEKKLIAMYKSLLAIA